MLRRPRKISAEPALVVLAMAVLLVAFHLITAPLTANGGGYDSVKYRQLVAAFSSGVPVEVDSPYAFRILPSAIVAWSGLDVVLGFYVLNVAAMLGAGLVLLAFLRQCGVPSPLRVYAVLWWAVLPFSLRFVVHYPVLVDGVGFLFAVSLLYAAMSRRLLVFAVLFAGAVLTRENLLVLAPLPLLRSVGRTERLRALLACVPAVASLVVIHAWPVITPTPGSLSTAEYIGFHAAVIVTNAGDQATRLVLSPLLALGLLLAMVAARPIAIARVFAREGGWVFFLVASLVSATLGGLDHDRYLLLIVPVLLVAICRAYAGVWGTKSLLALTAGQLVCARALVPMAGDETTHFSWMVSSAPISELLQRSAAIGALVFVAAVWLRLSARPRAKARAASTEDIDFARSGASSD